MMSSVCKLQNHGLLVSEVQMKFGGIISLLLFISLGNSVMAQAKAKDDVKEPVGLKLGSLQVPFDTSAKLLTLQEETKDEIRRYLKKGYLPPGYGVMKIPQPMGEGTLVDFIAWPFHVSSIVDDTTVLLERNGTPVLWLEGCSTDGLVTDEVVYIADPIECTGTKSYTTTLGAKRTIESAKMIPRTEFDEFLRKTEEAKYDVYKLKNGIEIKAKLIGYEDRKYILELEDKSQRKLGATALAPEAIEKLKKKLEEKK